MSQSTLPATSLSEFPQVANPATPTRDDRWRESNAAMLLELWAMGEQMGAQAFELSHPKPDPLQIALNGFPDVHTYRAHYSGCDE